MTYKVVVDDGSLFPQIYTSSTLIDARMQMNRVVKNYALELYKNMKIDGIELIKYDIESQSGEEWSSRITNFNVRIEHPLDERNVLTYAQY